MKVVILAAGKGSRLGNPAPKPLTQLVDGTTILQRQMSTFLRYTSVHEIYLVVGYKKEEIINAFPDVAFVYNHRFGETNTAKSLLCAMEKFQGEDVLWANGDVVFSPEVVQRVADHPGSCVAVNRSRVAEEEVKYLVSEEGFITNISKEVAGIGEAVGVNKVAAADLPLFRERLRECADNSYFEKGLELAIGSGLRARPVDITDLFCVEIDFPNDLKRVNESLCNSRTTFAPSAGALPAICS
jgi:L-glutamine-phosphate cytidylyltransferase